MMRMSPLRRFALGTPERSLGPRASGAPSPRPACMMVCSAVSRSDSSAREQQRLSRQVQPPTHHSCHRRREEALLVQLKKC